MNTISPEQQIANVRASLADLRRDHRRCRRMKDALVLAREIRRAEEQLRELERLHADGRLQPLDDADPF